MVGEAVQDVSRNSSRRTQGGEGVHAPSNGNAGPRQVVLKGLTKEDQSSEADDPGNVHTPQAVLWLVNTLVGIDVAVLHKVVEPMTPELGEHGANHGGKEEQGKVAVTKAISRAHGRGRRQHELGNCVHDADGPHGHDHDKTSRCVLLLAVVPRREQWDKTYLASPNMGARTRRTGA